MLDVLFNPKHAGHIWKVAVAIDKLGNIVWNVPLHLALPRMSLFAIPKVHKGPRGISQIVKLVPMMALIKATYTLL